MKLSCFPRQVGGVVLSLTLAACSPQEAPQATAADAADTPAASAPVEPEVVEQPAPAPAPVVCVTCGVVSSITAIAQEGRGTGVGAAVLGNNIEKNRNASTTYEIVIDMENGNQQIINVPDASGIAVGSKVTVQSGNISLR